MPTTQRKETELGMIPQEWEVLKIEDIVEGIIDNRGKSPPIETEGYGVIEVNALSGNTRYPDYSKVSRFVSKEVFDNRFRKGHPQRGDLLMSTVGSIGNVCIMDGENYSIAQNVIGFRLTKKIVDPLFCFYRFSEPGTQTRLKGIDIGAVQPSIKVGHLTNIDIPLPPLPEQQAIASILGSLDDKIELLREQNKTLEAIGQTIFKAWFGKYGVEDELPEGWRVGKLGEIAEITSGKRPNNKSDKQEGEFQIPMLGAGGIMGYTTDVLFDGHLIIMGRVGTHGQISRVNYPCRPSDNTLITQSKYFEYVYQIICGIDFASLNKGAVQPLITQTDIKNYDILIPSDETLSNFEKHNGSLFGKVYANNREIQSLTQTRDSLLPRLMSGKVRVGF